jgi:hypothetical protein
MQEKAVTAMSAYLSRRNAGVAREAMEAVGDPAPCASAHAMRRHAARERYNAFTGGASSLVCKRLRTSGGIQLI